MSDNLACARAREAAEAWMADRRLALPTPPRVSQAFAEQAMVDAFAAGHRAGEERYRPAWEELSGHLAWAQKAGSVLFDLMPRSLGRNIAEVATDLVAAAYPSLRPVIGRDGQDVKGRGDNPAEVLRDIAEGMVDGETIKGVDHASFDQAAEQLAQPVAWRKEGVADLAAFRLTTGDPRFDPAKPATINGYLFHPAKERDHG